MNQPEQTLSQHAADEALASRACPAGSRLAVTIPDTAPACGRDGMVTQIEYLADHPASAPVLASWHHREWADLLPGWSLEQALAELRTHTGRRQIPTTLIAVEGDRVIGSASLLAADLDGWEQLTPWLASVYVLLERRGRGVGRRLVTRAVEDAAALGIPSLYLWTAGEQEYYSRMGWELAEWTECHGHPVAIIHRQTGAGSR
jgi:predicted N-acetyltransferase YhbS